MLGLPALTWERFALWLMVGLLIYFFYSRRHSALMRPPLVQDDTPPFP
jgi:APA family basic amino acid/polyamine antiporter